MLALGRLGLKYDYFYSLTPRVFNNLLKGFFAEKERETELFMWGIRKLMYGSVLPYLKKDSDFKERDIFLLPSEDVEDVSVEDVELQVERDKEFWEKVDKAKEKKDVGSTG